MSEYLSTQTTREDDTPSPWDTRGRAYGADHFAVAMEAAAVDQPRTRRTRRSVTVESDRTVDRQPRFDVNALGTLAMHEVYNG